MWMDIGIAGWVHIPQHRCVGMRWLFFSLLATIAKTKNSRGAWAACADQYCTTTGESGVVGQACSATVRLRRLFWCQASAVTHSDVHSVQTLACEFVQGVEQT